MLACRHYALFTAGRLLTVHSLLLCGGRIPAGLGRSIVHFDFGLILFLLVIRFLVFLLLILIAAVISFGVLLLLRLCSGRLCIIFLMIFILLPVLSRHLSFLGCWFIRGHRDLIKEFIFFGLFLDCILCALSCYGRGACDSTFPINLDSIKCSTKLSAVVKATNPT